MAYATQTDLLLRVTEQELIQLTDDSRPPSAVNETVLGGVLDEASAIVDSYCRTRYVTPLQTCDDATRITRDITIWLLYSRRPQKLPEAAVSRYEAAMAFLKDVSTGKASLDQPDGTPTPQVAATGPVFPKRTGERFTEHNLEGFI